MKKLVMLALALVLFIPGTARAGTGPSGYLVVTTTCEEDADQPGTFDLRSHVDMWTNREKYKRMIVIYTEYRDYGDGWLLSRETGTSPTARAGRSSTDSSTPSGATTPASTPRTTT